MRELFQITALVLGLSLISPFWTEATPVVDQIFAPTVPDIPAGLGQAAQTFTVGASDTLVRIDVAVWLNTGGLDFPLLFELRPVDVSGVPSNDPSTALVNQTIPRASVPTNQTPTPNEVVAVDLGPGVPATAGDRVAIVLNGEPGGSYGLFANFGNGHAGGAYFWNFETGLWQSRTSSFDGSEADFGFRTSIDSATTVPAPRTLLQLIVTGVVSVVLIRRNGHSPIRIRASSGAGSDTANREKAIRDREEVAATVTGSSLPRYSGSPDQHVSEHAAHQGRPGPGLREAGRAASPLPLLPDPDTQKRTAIMRGAG